MKMYFICEDRGPQWWVSYGFLENGFCFGQHVCSHPSYAPGDLYFTRKERIEALEKLWGVSAEEAKNNCETVLVRNAEDVPDWFKEAQKKQDDLKGKYEEYEALVGNIKASVRLKMSDGLVVESV